MAKPSIKFNVDDLEKLISRLKDDYTLRVGILGSKAKTQHDNESGLTNADIGTFHEFGTSKMPQRSFLELSVREKLQFDPNEFAKIKKELFKQVFMKKKPDQFYHDLGAKILQSIEEAFDTNGFGTWAPWSLSYEQMRLNRIKSKKKRREFWLEHNILTDTGKLRHSISYKVIKNKQG